MCLVAFLGSTRSVFIVWTVPYLANITRKPFKGIPPYEPPSPELKNIGE